MTAQFTAHVTRHGLGLGQYGELVWYAKTRRRAWFFGFRPRRDALKCGLRPEE